MPAMRDTTELPPSANPPGDAHKRNGNEAKKDGPGSVATAPEPGTQSTPMSTPSEQPLSSLSKPWRKPKTIREFAAQANAIATMVLNGEIDIETARNYASLARVVSQTASIEVTRARFLKREPNLSLE